MADTNRTVGAPRFSEHVVQFFDTEESRAHNVAAFLADGYAAGEPLIVISRPVNWARVMEQLEVIGVPVRQAIADGTIVVKDANETLRQLSRHGSPDSGLFATVVGEVALDLARRTGKRIRAYGEMVDLLAQRGELPEAVTLECLWNGLGARVPMFLLCGYSSAHFVSGSTHQELLNICNAHSDVQQHRHDPLAAWVLTAAHTAPSALRH